MHQVPEPYDSTWIAQPVMRQNSNYECAAASRLRREADREGVGNHPVPRAQVEVQVEMEAASHLGQPGIEEQADADALEARI